MRYQIVIYSRLIGVEKLRAVIEALLGYQTAFPRVNKIYVDVYLGITTQMRERC